MEQTLKTSLLFKFYQLEDYLYFYYTRNGMLKLRQSASRFENSQMRKEIE